MMTEFINEHHTTLAVIFGALTVLIILGLVAYLINIVRGFEEEDL